MSLLEQDSPSFITGNCLSAYACQVSDFYFWLQETPQLSNQIPFQNSVSIFVLFIWSFAVVDRSTSKARFFPFGYILLKVLRASPGTTRKCGWFHGTYSSARQQVCACSHLCKTCYIHILRQSSQLSLGISLTGVFLWAKYGERPVEDCPCQLDRSPSWLFWEWLCPVLLVISCTVETGRTWPQVWPDALCPIYVAVLAGLWEVHDFIWELGVVCC